MSHDNTELQGPNLSEGVPLDRLKEGEPLLGHAHEQNIVLVRQGDAVYALSASCTHYGGPLAEGIVADGAIRCPWHHAAFELETGLAHGPGLDPVACFQVIRDGDVVRVGHALQHTREAREGDTPESVVIAGAGAAGAACAEELRRRGYEGPITLIGAHEPYPVDRPNLSKDFLAGEAPEEWLPLRTAEDFEQRDIRFVRSAVTAIDAEQGRVTLDNGDAVPFGALVLAMGAEATALPIPGADLDHVHTLHELPDARAIEEAAKSGEEAVIIGAGFIGLEAAASLTQQGMRVTVIAPEAVPLEEVMGEQLGALIQKVHEEHGVTFRLDQEVTGITEEGVTLSSGETLPASLVLMGVGVQPRTSLAEQAGIAVEDGVVVDERLRSVSHPNVWAVGDLASYPADDGDRIRIEHWAVAVRQGQAVARNLAGETYPFQSVPFFWSAHFDTQISYVGHAPEWDEVTVKGDLEAKDALVAFHKDGLIKAIATVGRDAASLQAEYYMEIGDQRALAHLST